MNEINLLGLILATTFKAVFGIRDKKRHRTIDVTGSSIVDVFAAITDAGRVVLCVIIRIVVIDI
jgi:hypothetical protein